MTKNQLVNSNDNAFKFNNKKLFVNNTFENFTIDANGTQAETFYLNWLGEPHELNGTLTLNFYFQEEGATLWNGKATSFSSDFVVEQEDIYGCIDPNAENYIPEIPTGTPYRPIFTNSNYRDYRKGSRWNHYRQ